MNFLKLKSFFVVAIMALAMFTTSCSDDNNNTPPPPPAGTKDFHLAFSSGSGSISGTYMQGVADITTGTVSFQNAGALLSTGRTSRIFPSADGKYVYSLTYQQGTIDKWEYQGGSNYTKVATIDASVPLAAKGIRFSKLSETEGAMHYITNVAQYDGTNYLGHKMTVTIGFLNFETMQIKPGFRTDIDLQLPGTLGGEGYNINRIDCPVLSNGKLYYGAAVRKFNTSTGVNEETDRAMTFVIDYPSLTNPTVIETNLASGSTNGYRTPTQHVNEAGEVYQMVSNGGNTGGISASAEDSKVTIVKLVNGQYDPTYKYSLDELLGNPAASNGFFYVGNGIAYIPYERKHLDQIQSGVDPSGNPTYSAPWGLARMDLINNTVVDLNVPDGLWLTQWQTSVVRDGKFYIALSPVGAPGHIYMFDVNSTSPDATLGALTVAGADQYFIGIY